MKRLQNWKSIAVATILTLLVSMQPAISYACTTTTHCGG